MLDLPEGMDVLPSSLESEREVIGGILLSGVNNSEAIDSVSDLLEPEMFFTHQHREIYTGIQALAGRGEPTDAVTVCSYLGNKSSSEDAHWGYSMQLTESVAGWANIRHYAQIIVDRYNSRRLMEIGSQLIGMRHEDIGESIAKAQSLVLALGDTQKSKDAALPISRVIPDWIDALDRRYNSGTEYTGLSTGFDNMDYFAGGLQGGDLIILAARPAMGKTSLAMNIAVSAAKRDKRCLFFSLEMPTTQLLDRVISAESRLPLEKIRRPKLLKPEDFSLVTSAAIGANQLPLTVDERGGLKISQIRMAARRQHRQNPLSLIVIDYLQLVQGEREKGDSKAVEVGSISRNCKAMAKELGIPVILLSQLNRSVETRHGDKRPLMSDIRESGEVEQDADQIWFIYRDDYYNENSLDQGMAEIIFSKNRNGQTGRTGLEFHGERCAFQNTERQLTPKQAPVAAKPKRVRGGYHDRQQDAAGDK